MRHLVADPSAEAEHQIADSGAEVEHLIAGPGGGAGHPVADSGAEAEHPTADSSAEAEHLIAVLGLGSHRADETTSQRRSSDGFSLLTPFEKRCAPILDAVAELCIFKDKRQVFAVALQFTPDSILLTIAESNGVPDETKTQLGNIWHFLRVFSVHHARMDGPNKSTNSEYDNFSIESPPMTES